MSLFFDIGLVTEPNKISVYSRTKFRLNTNILVYCCNAIPIIPILARRKGTAGLVVGILPVSFHVRLLHAINGILSLAQKIETENLVVGVLSFTNRSATAPRLRSSILLFSSGLHESWNSWLL